VCTASIPFSNVRPEGSHGILKAVSRNNQNGFIDWDRDREGYLDVPQKPVYAPVAKSPGGSADNQQASSIARREERLGSLIAAAGTIWAAYSLTKDYADLWRFQILPPGPIEVCALGILHWLHAKWRRSLKTR